MEAWHSGGSFYGSSCVKDLHASGCPCTAGGDIEWAHVTVIGETVYDGWSGKITDHSEESGTYMVLLDHAPYMALPFAESELVSNEDYPMAKQHQESQR